jgi:hypothetical protein
MGEEEAREEEKRERVREREQRKAEQRRQQKRSREIERIEGEISGLERALREVEGEMGDPNLARDHVALERLHERATCIRKDLKERYADWEGLHEEEASERAGPETGSGARETRRL